MGSISAIVSAVGLLGFLIFLAGIGLVVMSVSQQRPARGGVMLAVFGLIFGLVFTIVGQGILVVEPTQVGVIFNALAGDLEEPARGPGTSIIIPGIQQVFIYPTAQQEYTMSSIPNEGATAGDNAVIALTQDGQRVWLDITVIYRIDRSNANFVHLNWQDRYENDFIRPTVRSITRDVVSGFEAEDIYGVSREEMGGQIEDRMRTRMESQGLTLTSLLVREVRFTEEFAAAIEDKVIADQRAQQAEIRVREEEQRAQQVRVTAQGARDATIAAAEGRARSIILVAEANAEALRIVSEQIAANPLLIQYLYVQNLSDNVSIALVPTGTPFLFDFSSFQPNPDFTAPEVPPANFPDLGEIADPLGDATADDAEGGN